MSKHRWLAMVDHWGCISPCSGYPVLKTRKGRVWVAAHELPVYLQCSECGYAPGPEEQPELIKRFLEYKLKHKNCKEE